MNANNIGEFIQQLRKEKGLTQKELAEQIGMSDKTISKWENGNSVPDTSMLVPLCKVLDISVNELLSCEKLPPEDYSKKAEENIMMLMKEKEQQKKGSIFIGVALVLIGIVLLLGNTEKGYSGLLIYPYYFFDLFSLILVVLFAAGVIFVSGARSKQNILRILSKTIIPIGTVISVASVVIVLGTMEETSCLGINLAVSMIAFLYACMIKIVVELMIARSKV